MLCTYLLGFFIGYHDCYTLLVLILYSLNENILHVVAYTMMTSSNDNISRVTCPLCGEFMGHRWIPPKRPVTRMFDVFFDLRLNKQLSEQSRGCRFETPLCPIWCHCNALNSYGRLTGPILTKIYLRYWHCLTISSVIVCGYYIPLVITLISHVINKMIILCISAKNYD